MVFWGDLYDDFLAHSGLRSGNGAGGVVRFLCVAGGRCVRWWAPPARCGGGHLPLGALAGRLAGATELDHG